MMNSIIIVRVGKERVMVMIVSIHFILHLREGTRPGAASDEASFPHGIRVHEVVAFLHGAAHPADGRHYAQGAKTDGAEREGLHGGFLSCSRLLRVVGSRTAHDHHAWEARERGSCRRMAGM